MRSTPGSSGGRPETVSPKTTSSRPVSEPRTRPQAVWTTLLRVTPSERARSISAADTFGSTSSIRLSGSDAPVPEPATSVGAAPSSAAFQAASAAGRSWRESQARYSLYGMTGGSSAASPPAA
ncbi:Uncharacterised protein [Streptomyces griseus]|nr:Uncharacterised protein [Streptomyces griseus]